MYTNGWMCLKKCKSISVWFACRFVGCYRVEFRLSDPACFFFFFQISQNNDCISSYKTHISVLPTLLFVSLRGVPRELSSCWKRDLSHTWRHSPRRKKKAKYIFLIKKNDKNNSNAQWLDKSDQLIITAYVSGRVGPGQAGPDQARTQVVRLGQAWFFWHDLSSTTESRINLISYIEDRRLLPENVPTLWTCLVWLSCSPQHVPPSFIFFFFFCCFFFCGTVFFFYATLWCSF